jgi:hypothetical protein
VTDKNTTDLLVHTLQQKPIDFQQTFDDLLRDRLQDAIQAKKMEIAKNIFNTSPHGDEELENLEVEDDDTEQEEIIDFEEQETDLEDDKDA